MPIYEYRVDGTDEVVEHICAVAERPDVLTSSEGRTAQLVVRGLVAKTPGRWGDTERGGGYFDRGLGVHVSGFKEATRIAESRGLRSYQELGDETDVTNRIEAHLSRRENLTTAENGEQAEFRANLTKFDGDRDRAVLETWSPARVLAGDTIYTKSAAERF